jgi:hypothetical protein
MTARDEILRAPPRPRARLGRDDFTRAGVITCRDSRSAHQWPLTQGHSVLSLPGESASWEA